MTFFDVNITLVVILASTITSKNWRKLTSSFTLRYHYFKSNIIILRLGLILTVPHRSWLFLTNPTDPDIDGQIPDRFWSMIDQDWRWSIKKVSSELPMWYILGKINLLTVFFILVFFIMALFIDVFIFADLFINTIFRKSLRLFNITRRVNTILILKRF